MAVDNTRVSAKRALVTGASSGIGAAICERLLADGWTVSGVSRDAGRLAGDIEPVVLDLGDIHALERALADGLFARHEFDCVVLCAGAGDFGAIEQFSMARIRAQVDLNLTSQLLLLRSLVPPMKRRRQGNVILIGSEAALAGKRNGTVYCATKFAVRGVSQALREECAAAGVVVTVINPGMVDTPFFDHLDFTPGPSPEHSIQPDDVAAAVAAVLDMRAGTVVDEINLSPLKHVVRAKA